jgi:hypothetical protein
MIINTHSIPIQPLLPSLLHQHTVQSLIINHQHKTAGGREQQQSGVGPVARGVAFHHLGSLVLQHFSASFPFPPFVCITSESLLHTHPVAIPTLVLIWKPVPTWTVLGSLQLGLGTQSWCWVGQYGSLFIFVHLAAYICAEGLPLAEGFTMANLGSLHFMYLLSFHLQALVCHENGSSHPLMYLPSFPHTTTSIYPLLRFLVPLSVFLFHNELSTSWVKMTAS